MLNFLRRTRKTPIQPPESPPALAIVLPVTAPEEPIMSRTGTAQRIRIAKEQHSFSDLLEYLKQHGEKVETNALFKASSEDPSLKKQLDDILAQIVAEIGPVQTACLGEEAIVFKFKDQNHVLRITPRNRIPDVILFNNVDIQGVVKHYSERIGKDNGIVLSVVPKLTCQGLNNAQVLELYDKAFTKDAKDKDIVYLFSDMKLENIGMIQKQNDDGKMVSEGTPLITDLGAVKRFDTTHSRFDMIESIINAERDRLKVNDAGSSQSQYEWDIEKDGKKISKQIYYYGEPAESAVGKALTRAIARQCEAGRYH